MDQHSVNTQDDERLALSSETSDSDDEKEGTSPDSVKGTTEYKIFGCSSSDSDEVTEVEEECSSDTKDDQIRGFGKRRLCSRNKRMFSPSNKTAALEKAKENIAQDLTESSSASSTLEDKCIDLGQGFVEKAELCRK